MYAGDTKGDFEFKYRDNGPFNAGWQPIFVDFEVAAADTPVKIGFHIESAPYSYAGVCNFRLVKFGTANALDPILEPFVQQEKEALLNNELYSVVTGSERAALEAANFAQFAEAAAAFKNARAGYVRYANTMALLENYKERLNATDAYVDAEKLAAFNDLFNAEAPENGEALSAAAYNAKAVARRAVESSCALEGLSSQENQTSLIKNADAASVEGWTTEFKKNDEVIDRNMTAESVYDFLVLGDGSKQTGLFQCAWYTEAPWSVDFHQTLENLPVGYYRLSAFVRTNANYKYVTLYAGENSNDAVWYDNRYSVDSDNPDKGLYPMAFENVSVDFEVVETAQPEQPGRKMATVVKGTPVKIGVKTASLAYNYFHVTRFRLYSTSALSGIENVLLDNELLPSDNIYYDLMGRRVSNPIPGLYIHNGRKVYVK